MADDLQIKLVLEAVNKMSPQLEQAGRDLDQLMRNMQRAERANQQSQVARKGSLFDSNTWSALSKEQDIFQQRMDKLQRSGMNNIIGGGMMLAPVIATVKAAGDLEEAMNQIKIDTYDSSLSAEQWAKRVDLLRGTTVGLSREVKFSAKDIAEAVDSLVRGNVGVQEVADGAGRAAVYLAQASKMDPGQTAEAVAKIGNAWQQTGKQMESTADMLSRVDAASTASIPDLIEGFKYVSSTASNLKLDVRDVAVSLGVLNNAGIDASTAGTTLNQLFQHLQPTTKAAKAVFDDLGLSVAKNPFYDVNGRLKPMVEIIKILRNATKDMTDQQKQLAFSKVFDERGSRAVINLIKEGKNSYEDINTSLDRQMSLWDRIKTQNTGLNSQVEILKSNVTTLMSDSGSPLANELTGRVKAMNDAVVHLSEWSKEHPTTVTAVLDTVALVASARIAIGAIQLAIGRTATTAIGAWLLRGISAAVASGAVSSALAAVAIPTAVIGGATLATYGIYKGLKAAEPGMLQWANNTDAAGLEQRTRDYEQGQAINEEMRRLGIEKVDPNTGMVLSIDQERSTRFLQTYRDKGMDAARAADQQITQTNTFHIYARDAQDTAQQIGQVLNQPTSSKYINSRHPVPVMD